MAQDAESFEMVDKHGVVRIRLGLYENGAPYLALNDATGRERCIASLDQDGNGSLGFRSDNGQPVVTIGTSSELGSGMIVLDAQNEMCMAVRIGESGGGIELETRNGVFTWPTPDAKEDASTQENG